MDFELSDDQRLLLTSFEALLARFREPPQGVHGYVAYSEALQEELTKSGYLDVASQPGFGPLEGALLIEAAASCPVSVEIAASALVSPVIGVGERPVAVAWGMKNPVRYLTHARTICLCRDDEVLVGATSRHIVQPVDSVVAYPLARLTGEPDHCVRYTGEVAAAIRRRAMIGIAAEAAGLMRAALEHTVQYVKQREQFGQPLGNFQAIQHRLAEDAQLVRACRSLALRAAYLDDEQHAAVACLYAQDGVRKLINDCHQFCGAMGLTLEFPLHLWTYRLKFLQGEAGGRATQARRVAQHLWVDAHPEATDGSAVVRVAGG